MVDRPTKPGTLRGFYGLMQYQRKISHEIGQSFQLLDAIINWASYQVY